MTPAIMILYQVEGKKIGQTSGPRSSSSGLEEVAGWIRAPFGWAVCCRAKCLLPHLHFRPGLFTTHAIHDSVALLRLASLRPLYKVRLVVDSVKQVLDVDHVVVVAGGKRIVGEGKATALPGLPMQLEKPLQFFSGRIDDMKVSFVTPVDANLLSFWISKPLLLSAFVVSWSLMTRSGHVCNTNATNDEALRRDLCTTGPRFAIQTLRTGIEMSGGKITTTSGTRFDRGHGAKTPIKIPQI
ncbi:hypothetical protein CI102_12915 [Trichoderma harzianum]|nr:hypothetical protein CI102_12915 [Trichoderma harzianum]